jgi:sucrose-6-phosphate hydrolase SacC (GH32 family)
MKWAKRGLIFTPQGGWMKSHAQVPTPLTGDGFIRVYFSSRPEQQTSLTTFVDLDADDPAKIVRVNTSPILDLGRPGTFDEHGIMPASAIQDGDTVYLYYSGWSRAASVPYRNATGLAVSHDGGVTFEKLSEGPVLGQSLHDPFSATSPVVLKEDGHWHMWYGSGTGWLDSGDRPAETYDIKHARSNDGINWLPDGKPVIPQRTEYEAITRPCVIKSADGYHMWFCYRGSHHFRDGADAYRIGYAHSDDLKTWRRDDEEAGIGLSTDGWDSRMIAYPAVATAERTYLFYNGDSFGAGGFGYAILED